jgi:hypothetical protein
MVRALPAERLIVIGSPSWIFVNGLELALGFSRADLQTELEANAAQQVKDLQTDEYRERVARYLPNHYACCSSSVDPACV